MKKVVVIEKKAKTALVMTEDAHFMEIPLPEGSCEVGAEIMIEAEAGARASFGTRRFLPWISAVIAASLFAFLIWQSSWDEPFDTKVYAYITVDINPSVEIGINKSEQVVDVRAVNEDAEVLIQEVEFEQMQLEQFLETLLTDADDRGYLNENAGIVISTVVVAPESDQTSETLNRKWREKAEDTLHTLPKLKKKEVRVTTVTAVPEVKEAAKKQQISTGKYEIYLRAKENGEKIEIEDVRDSSVAEIDEQLGGLDQYDDSEEDEIEVQKKQSAKVEESDEDDDDNDAQKKQIEKQAEEAKKQAEEAKKQQEKAKEQQKIKEQQKKQQTKVEESDEDDDDNDAQKKQIEKRAEEAKKQAVEAKKQQEKAKEQQKKQPVKVEESDEDDDDNDAQKKQIEKRAEEAKEQAEEAKEQAEEAKKQQEKAKEQQKKQPAKVEELDEDDDEAQKKQKDNGNPKKTK